MMKRINIIATILFLILVGSLGLAGTASAVTYNLTADVTTKTMPDGTVVTMWGFACTSSSGPTGLCTNPGVITVPGPQLTVPVGDGTLTVNLTNNLPEEVSLIIPGLRQTAGASPVASFNDIQGRVRKTSFSAVATAFGGVQTYNWTAKPGTYLYQSGSHPQVQVQMGLYGAVKQNFATGQAYGASTSFSNEAVLLFSEIDPALHTAVAGGSYGPAGAMTSTINYDPKYFLLNGIPYSAQRPPLSLGLTGTVTIFRFLNAGLREIVPVINGMYMTLVAEDGNPYTYTKSQYSLMLAPGKTIDALVTNPGQGYYPLYERRLGVTNAAATGGGMMMSLEVTGPKVLLTVEKSGTGTGTVESASMPGGISCGTACSASYLSGTVLRLVAKPAFGSAFVGWAGGCTGTGDCIVTMDIAKTVNANFGLKKFSIGIYRTANIVSRWYLDNGSGHFNSCGSLPGQDLCLDLPDWLTGDIGVSGDWNGTGLTKTGIYRDGQWYLSQSSSAFGSVLSIAPFTPVLGDIPVTGDWDGNGVTDIGRYNNGKWDLYNITTGAVTVILSFGGSAGDIPVTGDWNGDGTTEIGIYRNGSWHLDNAGTHVFPVTPTYASFGGLAGDIPVAGDWDGNGVTNIGIYRNVLGLSYWYLDSNANGILDSCGTTVANDTCFGPFGGWSTDRPLTGYW